MARRTPTGTRSDGAITRNRILDEAERLFAVDGFAGVSVRQITAAAESDLAQVNYYFGSKDQLFHEILIRRVDLMTEERLARLSRIEVKQYDRATIVAILEAFLMPLIGSTPEQVEALRCYRHLIALVTNSKAWQEKVFKEHYDPVAIQFLDALRRALPSVAQTSILWAFTFFLGAAVNALAETGRIDRLSNGKCRSDDLETAAAQLIGFYAGGFLSLPSTRKMTRRRAKP